MKNVQSNWQMKFYKVLRLSIALKKMIYITVSIGISIGTITNSDRFTLLKEADMAMYRAKKSGKNRYCVYNDALGVEEVRKMELEKDLRSALKNNQFYIVYQPKWNVKTNSLYGFEALLRWEHP